VERLEEQLIRPADVKNICVALNNSAREASIAPFKSGALLREMLDTDGSVTVRSFLEWWVAEDCADTLQRFMIAEFQGRAALLERSTSQNFRFRIRLQDDESTDEKGLSATAASQTHSALSEVFAKFETNKTALCVQEYSVGQTTLEQIFNQFAAHQDNPEVAAILSSSSSANQRSASRNSMA
jgi:ATP-binding cassette subfamily A (ABC1) protein 3